MTHRKPLIAIGLAAVLLVAAVGPAAAHSWQTEVTTGDMDLGVSSTPETPIAGMETKFAGSITDNGTFEGEANRTDYGGVTNKDAEVHIKGPGHIHDHVGMEIPENDSHFHFDYIFPEPGTYTITVVTTIEGQEHAFEFEREVKAIPADARGETVDNIEENVSHMHEAVEDLQSQVESLEQQNQQLESQLGDHAEQSGASVEDQHDDENQESASKAAGPGFGIAVGLAAVTALVAFVVGKRN